MRICSLVTIVSSTVLLLLLPPDALGATGGKPLNVQVTLRGKKYTIPNVSTVRDLQESVERESGLPPSKQGVLFGGRKLKPSDVLSEEGVEDGSLINVVPSSGKRKSSSSLSSSSSSSNAATKATPVPTPGGSPSSSGTSDAMEQMMKNAGVDTEQLSELMKSIPGREDGKMPDMKESMEMMQDMMKSPMFQEYMTDPERLEQSRQMILENPMMKSMMGSMPGFEEILNDPEKWRETMVAAAGMYKDMDVSALMNAMGGEGGAGASGMGGMDSLFGPGGAPPGAFGLGNAPSPALDELSEGED